jgi:hypothetical protein
MVGQGRGQLGKGKERGTFPVPTQEMGVKTQNDGPQLLVLC